MSTNRFFLIVLLLLNVIVLLGQLWPDGAPPFARVVNIVFLVLSAGLLIALLRKKKNEQ